MPDVEPHSKASLRVFLDDDVEDRRPPGDDWEHVTTAPEAIALLDTGLVAELSLDHDLGEEPDVGTGVDVVRWLAEQQEVHGRVLWPRDGITVHTANPVGRDSIAPAIRHGAGRRLTVRETFGPRREAAIRVPRARLRLIPLYIRHLDFVPHGYDQGAMPARPPPRSAEWWRRDAERNERVRRARLRRDAAKTPGQNLEEGCELVRFAHEFSAAFAKARSQN